MDIKFCPNTRAHGPHIWKEPVFNRQMFFRDLSSNALRPVLTPVDTHWCEGVPYDR